MKKREGQAKSLPYRDQEMSGMAMTAVEPRAAMGELARREQARRSLTAFSEYIFPWYHAAAHHRLAAFYLEQVETYIRSKGATGIGRLLILMPPRHGKSQLASRNFPAWVLGRQPDSRIIIASYGADLAVKHGRAVREILYGDGFRAVYGDRAMGTEPQMDTDSHRLAGGSATVEISVDSRSAQSWDLAQPHRGGLLAAGVGGGITGQGANLFIVDDPFKNREEADSAEQRERVWEWWTSTAYTRLEDGAGVVGMLTRWHNDDWAGRLLKQMATDPKTDRWVILCLMGRWEPMELPEGKDWDIFQQEQMAEGVWIEKDDPLERKAGQALWEAKYNAEDLERIEANVGAYEFSALYQQSPYLRSGAMFRRDWFPVVESGPKAEEIKARVRYWDKAGTRTGSGGDYSAGVLMSITTDNVVYVEHVARGQWTPGKREEAILRTAQLDLLRPGKTAETWHQQDPGSAGLDSAMATNRKLAMEGITAHFGTVTGDKEVRAGPWSSACEAGQVRLVRGGWNDAFIEEHVSFPKGKYDDQVDAGSSAYSKVTGKGVGKKAKSYQG